jgi:8-oxo-dGTP pyrophosphatase MutT (NUDIX family)
MFSERQTLPFNKRLSCGVVVLNAQAELLLCHVTGQDHWDLPKGGIHDGESPLAAALRETEEETGLQLHAHSLLDLGCLAYRLRKDLHLFAVLMPRFDPATLWCDSRFADAAGQRQPEMDGYGWFAFDQINRHCTRKLATVLQERLNLHAVLRRLQSATAEPLARVA